jgi:DNA repair ATPase RecN
MEIQREQQKRIREKAVNDAKKAMAEYNELTDNDTLFDMDLQSFDKLKLFSDEIDNSLGGIDEYNRLMTLFNGMFADPKTIADMEERQSALNDLNSSYASLFDPITALNDAISDGVVDQQEYNALQAEILKLQEAGILTAEAAAEAQRNLDEAFNENTGLLAFISTLNTATDTLADDLAVSLMEGKNVLDDFKSFFKTLVQQLIADAIKMLFIIPILQAVGFSVGPTGAIAGLSGSGLLGNLGFKQTGIGGGNLMPNRPVLVGESGPEVFYPASSGRLSPNNMGTQVTYNINAVDAPSFQALVASDPEFIYSVTRAGARRIPGAR